MSEALANPHVLSHKARLAASDEPVSSLDSVQAALEGLLGDVGQVQVFQALIQMLPHAAVFVVDAERNLLCWSDNAEKLLGFKREDVLGRYCLTANRCHQCMLGCGISEYGAVTDVPLLLLNKDGEQVRVRKTARAFFDAEKRFIGGIEILVSDEPPPEASRPGQGADSWSNDSHADGTEHHTGGYAPQHRRAGGRNPYDMAPPQRGSGVAPETLPLSQPVLRKLPSPRTLSDAELKSKVHEALLRTDGHIGRAATLLGVSRPTLWRWRRKLDIDL